MEQKVSKQYIVGGLVFFLVIIALLGVLFFRDSKESIEKYDHLIDDTSYTDKHPFVSTGARTTPPDAELGEEFDDSFLNDMRATLRAVCSAFGDVNVLVSSRYYSRLHDKALLASQEYATTEEFTYIVLPGLVYDACVGRDANYIDSLVLYLQAPKESELELLSTEVMDEQMTSFIRGVSFDTEGVDGKQLQEDATYFNDYFLEKEKVNLASLYYPYYVKEREKPVSYVSKPIFTLDQDNAYKIQSLEMLAFNLKKLGIPSIEVFQALLLKNNGFSDESGIIVPLKEDYRLITEKAQQKEIDLTGIMGNVQDFQMYISAEKYAGLIADAEIQPLLVDLGEKMMIYSMVARDYADGINEDWSGNEFFGDAQTGNGIIRLHFIYLLTL